tara:strand:+ start:531 stop:818 length:288 start_codon:yes stop_codon:yes gene_type:complete
MNDKGIRAVYPEAVTIKETKEGGAVVLDNNGVEITIDQTLVDAWVDPNAYKYERQAEYPDFKDYLDGVVKGDQVQIDKYIADCLAVKAKYPKGTN